MGADEAITYITEDILREILKIPDMVEIVGIQQTENHKKAGLVQIRLKSPEFRLMEGDPPVIRMKLKRTPEGVEFVGFEHNTKG